MRDPDLVIGATTIGIDLRANTLTVTAPVPADTMPLGGADAEESRYGIIDIGTQGRLLGIELEFGAGHLSVSIADPTAADAAVLRSARIPLSAALRRDAAGSDGVLSIVFSRHGERYDISWPSGNQCWRRSGSGVAGAPDVTCAVVSSR
jgi:hypothetical protein